MNGWNDAGAGDGCDGIHRVGRQGGVRLMGDRLARWCLLGSGLLTALLLLSWGSEVHAQKQPQVQPNTSAQRPAAPSSTPRHLLWSDLVPPGWDPMADFRKRFSDPKLAMMDDADPKVLEMMRELRELWDKAPVNTAMEGVAGKLPGYVVPLDDGRKGMRAFLLVPYYGACIHSPPPPANQIVMVRSDKPVKGFHSMDTVWVHGTLRAERGDSAMGVSGWRIDAVKVERYERPPVETAP